MKRNYCGILAISVITLLFSSAFSGKISQLSKKASQLTMGMSREAVIHLLGPATWASIPSDKGEFAIPDPGIKLELYWRNPGCVPVVVDFDSNLRVIGWDEGRVCIEGAHLSEPSEEYSCSKPDRSTFCR
jgi:hypothetical protein